MNNTSKAVLAIFAVCVIVGVVFLILWIEKAGPFKVDNHIDTTPTPTPTTTPTPTPQTSTNSNSTANSETTSTLTSTVRTTDLGTLSRPATSPSQLFDEGIRANGYYYMDIGDGRGVAQYYVNFTLKGGPYVLIAQNMNLVKGKNVLFGIQNMNSPSAGAAQNNPFALNTTTLNTNITEIAVKKYLVMLADASDPKAPMFSYIYFVLDETKRTDFYNKLKDVNAKSWGNAANDKTSFPNLLIGKTSGEIYQGLSNPDIVTNIPAFRTWTDQDTVFEQHYYQWDSTAGSNFMLEVGASSRNPGMGGRAEWLGFDTFGTRILLQNKPENNTVMYPPAALPANETTLSTAEYANGLYKVTCSSGSDPYKVFDFVNETLPWTSATGKYSNGSYIGTEVTNYSGSTTGYRGEWVQIQLPLAIRAKAFDIVSYSDRANGKHPSDFAMFGSNNGTDWVSLGFWTNQSFYRRPIRRFFFPWNYNVYCSYFRLVINKVVAESSSSSPATADKFDLDEMRLFTQNSPEEITGSYDWHFVNF